MSTIDRLGGYDGTHREESRFKGPIRIRRVSRSALGTRRARHARRRRRFAARQGGCSTAASFACAGCQPGARDDRVTVKHAFRRARRSRSTPADLRGAKLRRRGISDGSAPTLDDVLQERGSIKG